MKQFTNAALKAMIVPLLVEQLLQMGVGTVSDWTVKALLDWIRLKSGKWTQFKLI